MAITFIEKVMLLKEMERQKNQLRLIPMHIALYGLLYITFFAMMHINNFQVWSLSRTMVVTHLSFFAVLGFTISIYGGYDIGKRKSRPVISSLILSAFITDAFSYLMLKIMNANEVNQNRFNFFDIDFFYLLLVMVMQFVIIILMVRWGNHFYFVCNPPESCCIIAGNQKAANQVMRKAGRYRLQFSLCTVVHYQHPNVMEFAKMHDTIFFAEVPATERAELLEFCYRHRKNVYLGATLEDVLIAHGQQVVLDDMSFIYMHGRHMELHHKFLKRAVDVVFSALALILFSPIMAIAALAILIDDGGPVIYKQKRITKRNRTFEIYKFRTMHKDACEDTAGHVSVTTDDSRITRVGRWLRKARIDELPQLYNILIGDMSIVGPRPEMIENVEKYEALLPAFTYRHTVKAGLTGYAQIEGKYNTSPEDKLMLDLMYIQNYSFWTDVKIMMRTLMVFFKKDSLAAFTDEDDQDMFPAMLTGEEDEAAYEEEKAIV